MPLVEHFVCSECQSINAVAKKCPSSEAPTMTTDGCDHITWPCSALWCYDCGELFTPDSIHNPTYGRNGYESD